MSVPARRTRLPRAEREQQMLETAHALFAERGFAAVTMEDVAAAVGVTKPLLYNYFGNKDRLFLACMQRSADDLIATIVGALGPNPTPTEAFGEGVRAFFAFVDRDRAAWRVLFDETLPASGEVAVAVAAQREHLTELIAAAILAQLPARAKTEVDALSHALLGAAEALARWWLRTDAMPAAEAAELLISTVEPGLRSRQGDPRK